MPSLETAAVILAITTDGRAIVAAEFGGLETVEPDRLTLVDPLPDVIERAYAQAIAAADGLDSR